MYIRGGLGHTAPVDTRRNGAAIRPPGREAINPRVDPRTTTANQNPLLIVIQSVVSYWTTGTTDYTLTKNISDSTNTINQNARTRRV